MPLPPFYPPSKISNMAKFSPERLYSIRRMRMARRLWKQSPLMAFNLLKEKYPDYTQDLFLQDLHIRKASRKEKRTKNPLTKYGRHEKIQQLLSLYNQTKDPKYYLLAQKLRSIITRPYRLEIKREGKSWEFSFPPEIPYKQIEQLSKQCQQCDTLDEAAALCNKFIQNYGYGK